MLNDNPVKAYPEVYMGTLEKAMQERNVDAYLDSRKLNIDCKNAIEQAIAEGFDGMRLNPDAAVGVVEKYGEERVAFVLANTLKQLSYDDRFSDGNKQWADGIDIPENISRGMDLNRDYIVNSHPAVLNGFIDMARNEIRTRKLEEVLGVKNQHITETTRGYEADGHTGTWYAMDMKTYHGERFFQMRNEEYGQDVADIIVSENGTLVAEDIWHGFDEGAREAISEYLEENGATVYDLTELPQNAIISLNSGQILRTEKTQVVQEDNWAETLVGKNETGKEVWFNFCAVSSVVLPDGITLRMPEFHYIDNYYLMEDMNAKGVVKVERFESLDDAMHKYLEIPNHQKKVLGIQNTENMQESIDFIVCENGIDKLTHEYEKIGGWLNPEVYESVKKMEDRLDMYDVQIAYQVGEKYFTIQTAEDGYDYTFYDKDYLELDGGVYDDPTISISEAMENIFEEEGLSVEDARVMNYESLEVQTEHAEKEHIVQVLLEQNCPESIFDGYDREVAMKNYEGITVQFAEAKTYLTVQPTEEGYAYIFYDADLHEVVSGEHDHLDASIQEATYEILKKEGMEKEVCVKVDDAEFREKLISNAKALLENGITRKTSELGRCEAALNGMNRAEVEYDVLAHTRAVLEEMGLENEVTLIGARVYGSRSREGMYHADSDLDVVLSYRGNVREDVLFNAVNEAGLKIAGIPIDINPISEEKTGTLAEYMKRAEAYLDEREQSTEIPQQPDATISFYVAECMEFPVMGEYHENLTLEEALQIYETIPAERMNGIKGVGFELHDGSDYDGPYDLMRLGKVDRESVEMIRHYKESPLVQKAMDDVEKYFAQKQELTKRTEQAVGDKSVQKENGSQPKSRKESVLQALRERQAKIKEQEQNTSQEKSRTHKKGEVSL